MHAPSTTDSRFDAIYRGVIEDAADVDTYRVKTGKFAPGTAVTLNAMVWGLDGSPLDPRLRVFDQAGNPVAFQVLANDAGLFSLQVPNAVAGKDYFVQVAARTPGGANDTGNYFVAADFNRIEPLAFDGVTSGTVSPGQTETESLTIADAGVFHFALAPTSIGARDHERVRRERSDRLHADRGIRQARRHRDALPWGWNLHGAVHHHSGSALSPVGYDLFLLQLSEGVGPYATTTTSPPPGSSGSTSPSGSTYTYSGSSTSKPSGYGYTF